MKYQKIVIVLVIIGVILLLFSLSKCFHLTTWNIKAYNAIPSNTALFIEVNGLQKIKELSQNSSLKQWSLIKKIPQDIKLIEDLVGDQEGIKTELLEKKIIAAAMSSKSRELDFLYLIDDLSLPSDLESILENKKGIKFKKNAFLNEAVYEFKLPDNQQFSIANHHGLLILARYSLMVEDAISQLKNARTNLCNSSEFCELLDDADYDKDLSLYANFAQLPSLLKVFSKGERQPEIERMSELFSWVRIDTKKEKDRSRIVGKLLPSTNNQLFSKLQNNSKGISKEMYSIIPNNVAVMQWIGIPDGLVGEHKEKYRKYFQPWIGEEAAYLITETFSPTAKDEQFLVLKTDKPDLTQHFLDQYGQEVGQSEGIDYNGFYIKQLQTQQFLEDIFSHNAIYKPHYTIIGDYVVFCNERAPLEVWIDRFIVGQTLSNHTEYLQTNLDMLDKGVCSYYVNGERAGNLIKSYLDEERNDIIRDLIRTLPNAGNFILDAIPEQNYYQLLGFLKPLQEADSQASISWKTPLSANAAIPPQAVKIQKNGAYHIAVQDERNKIYLLSRGGKIKWERDLSSPILSEIYEIDFYKTGDLYLVFNTKEKIYMLDAQGNDAKHFPIQLQSNATNGMTLIDFDKRGDYDFFVACENGNIYGFSQKGKPISGWNPNFNKGIIKSPLQHFQNKGKDYIFAFNEQNKLQAFRRSGAPRFNSIGFSETFISPPFFENNDVATRIVLVDARGKAKVVNTAGQFFNLNVLVGNNENVKFALGDVVGDQRADYISLSDKDLAVYVYEGTAFNKQIDYQFDATQDEVYIVPNDKGKKQYIGTLCNSKKQINLLTNEGELHPDFPLAGTTKFEIVDLYNDGQNTLIVANGKSVYSYILP